MNLQAITEQLHLVNGKVQEHEDAAVPGLFSKPAPASAARGREGDTLFVHVTLSGQLDETANLHNIVAKTFADHFFGSAGSATAALRSATAAANNALLDYNKSGQLRREGALIAAVLREQELFMVQVGEAFAFIGHSFGLEPIPTEKPDEFTALGHTDDLDIRFSHNWLQTGDLLLLADPRIGHLPNQAFVLPLVGKTSGEAQDGLKHLLHRYSARLLLVSFSETGKSSFIKPPEIQEESNSAEPSLSATRPFKLVDTGEDTEDDSDEKEKIAAIRRRRRNLLAEKRNAPTVPINPLDEMPITLRPKPVPLQPTQGKRAPVRDIPPNPAAIASDLSPSEQIEQKAINATAGIAGRLADATRWLAEMLNALRSPPEEHENAPANEPLYALLIAIVIPVVVGLIVSGVFIQGGQRSNLSQMRLNMETSLQEAGSAEPARARELYQNVLALVEESLEITNEDDAINQYRDMARQQLDVLDNVVRLQGEVLYRYPDDVQLSSISIGVTGDGTRHLFVLDTFNDVVYRHDVDRDFNLIAGEPQRIATRGDSIQAHIVGELVDMVWKPGNSETRDSLAILDSKGAAIIYFPEIGDRLAVPLGLASEWGEPTALATYISRLYVLDRGDDVSSARLWRYVPNGNGFQINEGSKAVPLPELEAATDLILNPEDASILTLYEDGRFRRIRNERIMWDETTLAEQGFAEPLVSPNAVKIVGTGLPSRIYVLDPGSNRLIEISFAGKMLTQFRANFIDDTLELFDQASDFVVLEDPVRILVLRGNAIAIA
ncbi:MAG: hypothetical protein ACPG8W_19630, partial [Candidatus Promineifilaceae bacterium]